MVSCYRPLASVKGRRQLTKQTSMQTKTSFTFHDLTLLIDYTFSSGRRGCRDSLGGIRGAGPPLEPDDPPEIEITKITMVNTNTQECEVPYGFFTDEEIHELETICWINLQGREADQEPPDPPSFYDDRVQ